MCGPWHTKTKEHTCPTSRATNKVVPFLHRCHTCTCIWDKIWDKRLHRIWRQTQKVLLQCRSSYCYDVWLSKASTPCKIICLMLRVKPIVAKAIFSIVTLIPKSRNLPCDLMSLMQFVLSNEHLNLQGIDKLSPLTMAPISGFTHKKSINSHTKAKHIEDTS